MPSEDERPVVPQTYGNAPGWSQSVTEKSPSGVPAAPPPADVEAAPSADVVEETPVEQAPEQAPPTPSQPAPTEPPFHEHPRWREVQQEKEALRQQNQQLMETLQRMAPQPQAQPEVDPYAGMDPQTAEFYRQMDRRIEQKAAAIASAQLQGLNPVADNIRRELAEMKIATFRRDNPDIKPGSQDEVAIAGFVQQGYDLNAAKKLALYDKLETENRAFKSKQASVPRRIAAGNSEASSGIPAASGLPPRQGDWRDRVSDVLDRGGDFKEAANAIFGKPRR